MSRTPTERRSERRQNASQTRPDQTRVLSSSAFGSCGHPSHPSLQSVGATSQTMDGRSAGYSAVVS